jgi:hypothetical protein
VARHPLGTRPQPEGGVAHVVYEGRLEGSHLLRENKRTHGEATLTGVARYDAKAGRLLSLLWVFEGVHKMIPPYDQPRAYSGVVEWLRDGVKAEAP